MKASGVWSSVWQVLGPLDRDLHWAIEFMDVCMHRRPVGEFKPGLFKAKALDTAQCQLWPPPPSTTQRRPRQRKGREGRNPQAGRHAGGAPRRAAGRSGGQPSGASRCRGAMQEAPADLDALPDGSAHDDFLGIGGESDEAMLPEPSESESGASGADWHDDVLDAFGFSMSVAVAAVGGDLPSDGNVEVGSDEVAGGGTSAESGDDDVL